MTDEQKEALAKLAEELRLLAKGATASAGLVEGQHPDLLEDPQNPALPARALDLLELDLRARMARVERSLQAARAALAPGPLHLVEEDRARSARQE